MALKRSIMNLMNTRLYKVYVYLNIAWNFYILQWLHNKISV